ncbi:response regulator transcription factor [Clostridium sp.]|uniref:response regulator transcription factor n=1 Tax=Clostridium sp. TaxID=1506 RepID=UPI00260F6BD2|nr:response regulator transcription factor [Clostridium sp.]
MEQKRILVVDDNDDICSMIKRYLEVHNYYVETYEDGVEALKIILENKFDLIILDIMMNNVDGIEICSIIRDKINCPIIFLSAKNLEEDKVSALAVGGDDYITKPFGLKELMARIECHLRREERISQNKNYILSSKNMIIDILTKEVFCSGTKLKLRKKEYEIIEFFMLNKNIMFSKEQIFNKVWGIDSESYLETVTESIKNIRRKIKEADPNTSYITTVYGFGYKWEVTDAK